MTARVLVVDDVPANVKLLEARLSAEYFDVITAYSGADALAVCRARRMRHRAARRHDAGHGRLRGLPHAQDQSGDPPHPGGHGDRARPALRPRQGAGGRRRRFPHQAGDRRGAGVARAFAGAVEDGDRRAAHARAHLQGNRHPEPGARGGGRDRARRPHPDRRRPQELLRAHGGECCRPSTRSTWRPIRARRCSTPPKAITTC